MKTIQLMFDSLNRDMLSAYGCHWTVTPNFQRLARRTVRFDSHYAGSLPCMPARRELHTGRHCFLHRGWGPLEPWDDSVPEILREHGVYTHLVSDHIHYWEDGGANYHTRYNSWELVRGQEGDRWKALPSLMEREDGGAAYNRDGVYFAATRQLHRHDRVNRRFLDREERMPMARTFHKGMEFIRSNRAADRWFLQIECFDPHEPFFTQDEYRQLYPHCPSEGSDWPPYYFVTEGEDQVRQMRLRYSALLSMCDRYLGRLLDLMDELNLWEDTMLIVNTDHGYLLGEHGWWSKTVTPVYNEIARIPLFVWDPRTGVRGESRDALTQTIDLPATLLEFFGLPLPPDMEGRPLRPLMETGQPIRNCALFGFFGNQVNITDGRYVYMRAPDRESRTLYEYTLMPAHMRCRFSPRELSRAEQVPPLPFTKGCGPLRVPVPDTRSEVFGTLLRRAEPGRAVPGVDNNNLINAANFGDKLYDLEADPGQQQELDDPRQEARMARMLLEAMAANHCPPEQFTRFGLDPAHPPTPEEIRRRRRLLPGVQPDILPEAHWTDAACNTFRALEQFVPGESRERFLQTAAKALAGREGESITHSDILALVDRVIPPEHCEMIHYFVGLSSRVR